MDLEREIRAAFSDLTPPNEVRGAGEGEAKAIDPSPVLSTPPPEAPKKKVRKDKGLDTGAEAKWERDDLADEMADAMKHAIMPDLKSIICAFTRLAGGASGVAGMLMREYKDAKPGTMIRSMILQMILQGSKAVAAKESSRDASMISDEDLDKEVKTILGNVRTPGVANGRTSP